MPVECNCRLCGKVVVRWTAELERRGAVFCSRACHAAWRKIAPPLPLAVRFWRHVDVSGGPDACWLWTGSRKGDASGAYGLLAVGGHGHQKRLRAHRVAWELHHGPIPAGLHVCHRCDNPPCVNPAHLFLGSRRENMQDMVRKGRHRASFPRLIGADHSQAKLTDAQVLEMRARYSRGGITQAELAAEYGVSSTHVSGILTRRFWPHLP